MIEITRNYGAKTLRMFVEDGSVLISARDIGTLINDKNPSRRLDRAGVVSSRYRLADTNGGVQRLRLVTPKECAAVLEGIPHRRTLRAARLAEGRVPRTRRDEVRLLRGLLKP